MLFKNGTKIISDGALVAITLMIAESVPKEKDVMVILVMNLLQLRKQIKADGTAGGLLLPSERKINGNKWSTSPIRLRPTAAGW